MNKIHKIVRTVTNKKSNIVYTCLGDFVYNTTVYDGSGKSYEHIHILSDEKIKENDWTYSEKYSFVRKFSGEENVIKQKQKKIIASTDKELNVPIFPESFVKEFCKQNGIYEVDTNKLLMCIFES